MHYGVPKYVHPAAEGLKVLQGVKFKSFFLSFITFPFPGKYT